MTSIYTAKRKRRYKKDKRRGHLKDCLETSPQKTGSNLEEPNTCASKVNVSQCVERMPEQMPEQMSEQDQQRLIRVREAVRTILECVGEDPDREGLLNTPTRYAKALLCLTSGYETSAKNILRNALFREVHDGLIVVKDLEIRSLCEHHLLPFIGKVHIGYIPSGTIIGLSKLQRITDMFARRLQVQERVTMQIAQTIMEELSPQGVAVIVEAHHMCMTMRGVQITGSSTTTSCYLGTLKQPHLREELMSLLAMNSTRCTTENNPTD